MPLLAQPMPEAEASRVRIDFVLKAGSVVRGRVVSADGTPVEQAIVNIKDPERDWHLGGATDYDGLYSIPIESTGEHQISAEKRSLGLASAISFAADANRDIDLPDIVLKGTDCLSGTVVFPDGTPIEGVEIYAYMEKPREKRTRPTSIEAELSRRRDASHKDLLGCTQGEAITDRDGSFTIRGLHPGQYKVTPRTLHDFMGTEEMDTDHLSQMHDSGTAHIGFILPIHLIHARMREYFGAIQANPRSRFLENLPDNLIECKDSFDDNSIDEPFYDENGDNMLREGDVVSHPEFGQGIVMEVGEEIVAVKFTNLGTKKLAKEYAPIQKL